MTRIAGDTIQGTPGDHVVQIYGCESELLSDVGSYLAGALARGDIAMVVADQAHRNGFADELASLGVDVEGARRDELLVELDAATLLSQFVDGGEVDAAAFDSVIGAAVRTQAGRGRGVRIYGEMVALLWDAGHVLGALELESLWNELGSTVAFTLLCAYPADAVLGAEHAEALGQVCGLHSSVLGAPADHAHDVEAHRELSRSAQFPRAIDAPRKARHLVVESMLSWGSSPDAIDNAALVATELAANAVVHATSAFNMTISAQHGSIRIAVTDDKPLEEADLVVRLGLVAGLSRRWGAEVHNGGKVIWAELQDSASAQKRQAAV
jgi:anti-sigma regulatory factor (Ser/Thr protein kinase)